MAVTNLSRLGAYRIASAPRGLKSMIYQPSVYLGYAPRLTSNLGDRHLDVRLQR
jgi:hypothetical protein